MYNMQEPSNDHLSSRARKDMMSVVGRFICHKLMFEKASLLEVDMLDACPHRLIEPCLCRIAFVLSSGIAKSCMRCFTLCIEFHSTGEVCLTGSNALM